MDIKKKLFSEIENHLLNNLNPSEYFTKLLDNKIFFSEFPFTFLSDLLSVEQSPIHHAEGNVWNHTLMVVDEAAKRKEQSENKRVFMWAALLHDIGKTETTKVKKGKITSYDHDIVGAKQVPDFFNCFINDEDFIKRVTYLVRWHMQLLFVVNNMAFANIKEMKSQTSINEVALLGLCDRLGRGNVDVKKEAENVRIFLEKCKSSKYTR